MNHHYYLERCLTLAKQSIAKGNHPFGALLVHRNQIIASSENEVESKQDVTAHAELLLVQKVQNLLTTEELAKSTLYSSTEPCPMCLGAIYWSGIGHVVHAFKAINLTHLTGHGFTTSSEVILQDSTRLLKMESVTNNCDFEKIHRDFWPRV